MENNKNFKKWTKIIFLGILLYWALFNLKTVGSILSTICSILFPLILGAFIALILNVPMRFFERKFQGKDKKKKVSIGERILAIVLSIVIIVFVITLVFNLIVPELIKVVKLLINNIPYYRVELNNLFNKLQTNYPDIDFKTIQESVNSQLDDFKYLLANNSSTLLNSSIKMVKGIFSGITRSFIAIVFAFYILTGKDRLRVQTTRFAKAYLKDKADRFLKIVNMLINNFSIFIGAQCVEAIILGSLCALGMLILRIPYAVTIGVLVGVTALIPIVGAFIGMAVGAILILSVSPFKVIVFVIFLFLLQQFENNVIYPRVVGNKIGLPGMWVLVSITIGGSLLGIPGMLMAVPIGTTIHTLIIEKIEKTEKAEKGAIKGK